MEASNPEGRDVGEATIAALLDPLVRRIQLTSSVVRISAYDVDRHLRRRYGADGPPPDLVDQWFDRVGGHVISAGASWGSLFDEGPWPVAAGRHAFELPRITYEKLTGGNAPPTTWSSA